MRRTVLGVVALSSLIASPALTAGAAAQGDRNPSPYPARTEAVADVRKVKVEGPFKVFVMSGNTGESSVTLSGPSELLADASARVEDGVLVIAFREGAEWSWNPGSGMHAIVNLPALEGVEIDGAAQLEAITLEGPTSSFSAAVNGSGRIKVSQLDARSVTLAVGGSGTIAIDGTAGEVSYALGGAGTIDAKRLRAASGTIALGGAGSIYADISGPAQIDAGGSGKVEVVGGASCATRAAPPAQVECR